MIAEIRFLAPESWRGRVKTAEVRRLLQAYGPGSLGPDPGTGPYLAKVRLNREWVKGLAELAGRDVSGFLRCLLAPRLPSTSPAPPPNGPAAGPTPKARATTATKPVIPTMPANRPGTVQAYCSVCGRYQEGIMAGVPQRFQCSVCGGS